MHGLHYRLTRDDLRGYKVLIGVQLQCGRILPSDRCENHCDHEIFHFGGDADRDTSCPSVTRPGKFGETPEAQCDGVGGGDCGCCRVILILLDTSRGELDGPS